MAFFSDQIYRELAYDDLAKQVRKIVTRPPKKKQKFGAPPVVDQRYSFKHLHRHLGSAKRILSYRELPEEASEKDAIFLVHVHEHLRVGTPYDFSYVM